MAANVFAKTKTFLGEVDVEMKKVTWPTRETLKTYTLVVMFSTAVVSIAIGVWDKMLSSVLAFVFKHFLS